MILFQMIYGHERPRSGSNPVLDTTGFSKFTDEEGVVDNTSYFCFLFKYHHVVIYLKLYFILEAGLRDKNLQNSKYDSIIFKCYYVHIVHFLR